MEQDYKREESPRNQEDLSHPPATYVDVLEDDVKTFTSAEQQLKLPLSQLGVQIESSFTISVVISPFSMDSIKSQASIIQFGSIGQQYLSIMVNPEGNIVVFYRQKIERDFLQGQTKIKPGKTYFLVLVYEQKKITEKRMIYQLSLYLNGKSEGEVAITTPIDQPAGKLFLGSQTANSLYQGEIRQLLITYRAFDKIAIESIYNDLKDPKLQRPTYVTIPQLIHRQDRKSKKDSNLTQSLMIGNDPNSPGSLTRGSVPYAIQRSHILLNISSNRTLLSSSPKNSENVQNNIRNYLATNPLLQEALREIVSNFVWILNNCQLFSPPVDGTTAKLPFKNLHSWIATGVIACIDPSPVYVIEVQRFVQIIKYAGILIDSQIVIQVAKNIHCFRNFQLIYDDQKGVKRAEYIPGILYDRLMRVLRNLLLPEDQINEIQKECYLTRVDLHEEYENEWRERKRQERKVQQKKRKLQENLMATESLYENEQSNNNQKIQIFQSSSQIHENQKEEITPSQTKKEQGKDKDKYLNNFASPTSSSSENKEKQPLNLNATRQKESATVPEIIPPENEKTNVQTSPPIRAESAQVVVQPIQHSISVPQGNKDVCYYNSKTDLNTLLDQMNLSEEQKQSFFLVSIDFVQFFESDEVLVDEQAQLFDCLLAAHSLSLDDIIQHAKPQKDAKGLTFQDFCTLLKSIKFQLEESQTKGLFEIFADQQQKSLISPAKLNNYLFKFHVAVKYASFHPDLPNNNSQPDTPQKLQNNQNKSARSHSLKKEDNQLTLTTKNRALDSIDGLDSKEQKNPFIIIVSNYCPVSEIGDFLYSNQYCFRSDGRTIFHLNRSKDPKTPFKIFPKIFLEDTQEVHVFLEAFPQLAGEPESIDTSIEAQFDFLNSSGRVLEGIQMQYTVQEEANLLNIKELQGFYGQRSIETYQKLTGLNFGSHLQGEDQNSGREGKEQLEEQDAEEHFEITEFPDVLPAPEDQWNEGQFQLIVNFCANASNMQTTTWSDQSDFCDKFNHLGAWLTDLFPQIEIIANYDRPVRHQSFDVYIRGVGGFSSRDDEGRLWIFQKEEQLDGFLANFERRMASVFDYIVLLCLSYTTALEMGRVQEQFLLQHQKSIPQQWKQSHPFPVQVPPKEKQVVQLQKDYSKEK